MNLFMLFNDFELLFQYNSSFTRSGFLLTLIDNEIRLPVGRGDSQGSQFTAVARFASSSDHM